MNDERAKIKAFFVHKLNTFYPDWLVFQAKQDYSVGEDRYIVVDMLNEYSIGDHEVIDYENEEISFSGMRESTVNVQAFGKGSVEALSYLWLFLQKPSVVDEFHLANIAVNSASNVQDLTNLLDNSRYQERASIDLTVSFSRTINVGIPFFDSIGIEKPIGKVVDRNVYIMSDGQAVTSNGTFEETKKIYNTVAKSNDFTYEKYVDIEVIQPSLIRNGGKEANGTTNTKTKKVFSGTITTDTKKYNVSEIEGDYVIDEIKIDFDLTY